jgi:hypothetical protein
MYINIKIIHYIASFLLISNITVFIIKFYKQYNSKLLDNEIK